MYVVVANIVALMASFIMIVVGMLKDKKQILIFQTLQIALLMISNVILSAFTGAIVNLLSCFRNVLCYKGKLNVMNKILITSITIGVPLLTQDLIWIDLLPIACAVIYVWCMNTNDMLKFKVLTAGTSLGWFIYDFYIMSYTSALFDLGCAITSTIVFFQIKRKGNKK